MPNQKTTQTLAELLKSRARANKKDRDSPIMPNELYEAFQTASLDYKGALSSGYSQNGVNVSVEAGLDLGDAILPGFVTLKATATVSGTSAKQALIVTQRQPELVFSAPTGYQNEKVVSLLNLRGKYVSVSAGIGAEAGVGLPDSITNSLSTARSLGPEEATLSFDVGASGNVKYEGEYLHLSTARPEWFPSPRDQQLIARFDELIGPGNKAAIKQEVVNFLGLGAKKMLGVKRMYSTKELLASLSDYIRTEHDANKALAAHYYAKQLNRLKRAIKNEVYNWLLARQPQYSYPLTLSLRRRVPQTNNLKNALEAIISLPQSTADKNTAQEYKEQITNLTDAPETTASPAFTDGFCVLHLWGHKGSGGASAHATAGWNSTLEGKSMSLGSEPGSFSAQHSYSRAGHTAGIHAGSGGVGGSVSREEQEFSANISVGTDAKGSMKHTAYRFQTWSDNAVEPARPLIITQDTVINYRQASFDAKAEATAGSHSRGKEGNWAYNMMTYRSAVAFWLYEHGGTHVTGQTGTGLCFGVSVQFSRLLKNMTAASAESPFIQSLAYKLCVQPSTLIEFLQKAAFIQEQWYFPTDVILLESAWAAPKSYPIPLTNGKVTKDLLDHMRENAELMLPKSGWRAQVSSSSWTLQSITARYRIADLLDDSREIFKLGVSIIASLNITLQKVEKAGINGIVDIDTYWIDSDLKGTRDIRDAYLKAVPRVALFHQ